MRASFRAPWSNSLRWTSLIFLSVIILAMVFTGFFGVIVGTLAIILSLMLLVRGYTIANGVLTVHGLIWFRTFPLRSLCDIEYTPNLTAGSTRTFGLGGLFSYMGNYYHETVGNYRAYVTDGNLEVTLYFNETVVVISPEDPLAFIEAIRHEYRRIRVN